MKLFELIFGLNGADKLDAAYAENCKARREIQSVLEERNTGATDAAKDVLSMFGDPDAG